MIAEFWIPCPCPAIEFGIGNGDGCMGVVLELLTLEVHFIGAPGEIRTPDTLVRSQVLYPAELRAHGFVLRKPTLIILHFSNSFNRGPTQNSHDGSPLRTRKGFNFSRVWYK